MKTFKLKIILTFKDGQQNGTLNIKASSLEEAQKLATEKLKTIWLGVHSISFL